MTSLSLHESQLINPALHCSMYSNVAHWTAYLSSIQVSRIKDAG